MAIYLLMSFLEDGENRDMYVHMYSYIISSSNFFDVTDIPCFGLIKHIVINLSYDFNLILLNDTIFFKLLNVF